MRTISYSECDSFEEVRKLLERAFTEIDEINFVIAPEKAKYQKRLAADKVILEKKAIADEKRKAKAVEKAKIIADAKAVIAADEAAKESAKKREKERVEKLENAKKVLSGSKKKGFFVMAIVMLFVANASAYVATDINYDIASNPETLQQYLRDSIASGTFTFTPMAAPAGNDIIEGKMYYDITANTWYGSNDGSTWTAFDTGSATSLDGAYNVGSSIDVDTSAVTMTTSDGDNNVVLAIVQEESTSNNDGVTIEQAGTGDALQISPQETTSGGINVIGKAAGSVPLIILDSSTNNMNLADNKGQLLIQSDSAYADAGAAGLVVIDTASTPITAAEGFLARFIHAGTARTNSSAVEIEVPATQPALAMNGILAINGQNAAGAALVQIDNVAGSGNADGVTIASTGSGDALQITVGETDGVAQRNIAAASQTTSLAVFDGATSNWDGADNIGMVHITTDDPVVDTGASLLQVTQSGTPIASAEGFLARFIQSGTAATDATAVEIEVKATQPALAVNGITKINGQDAAGATLFQVAGVGASGNADAMLISNTGSGHCLQITPGEADSGGVNITSLASSTVPMVILDGATNNWDGADNKGQLTLTQDDAVVHTGATQLMIHNTGTTVAAAEGFLARFVQDTGAAVTDAYAVEIEVTATTPNLKLNGQLSIAGQGATDGVLLDIVSADTDNDTVQLTGVGTADVLQITPNATTAIGINVISKASGTTSDVIINGVAGWSGANDVGLVEINSDSALADNGASLLIVSNITGQPKDGAEGFLARFTDTGTARTTAHAVEIETTNTTPALKLNNQLTITGADSAGVLMLITGANTTGNTDTLQMTHAGTGDAMQVTLTEPGGRALAIVGDAAGTHPQINIDLETGAWVGAATTGAIEVTNDGLLVADASLLRLENKGQIAVANDGACLEVIDSGAARATSYAVRIASTSNEAMHVDAGIVLIDESLTATLGNQFGLGQTITADDAEGVGQVNDGVSYVTVTAVTENANDFITLPNDPPVGTVLIVSANGTGFEIRTLQAGNDTINTVDTSDGGTEYVMNDLDIATFIFFAADSWTGTTITTAGVRSGTVTPD